MTNNTPSVALYRLLILLLPRDFRMELGDDMARLFQDRLAETPSSWGRLQIWVAGGWDLFLHGMADRWERLFPRKPRASRPGPVGNVPAPVRRARPPMLLPQLLHDFRFTVRTLRSAPIYTSVVISTLAVGIALNSVVFSVMNPFLLRPLPYRDAERLVHLGGVDPVSGWDGGRFSFQQITDLRSRTRSFEGLAGYYYGPRNLSGDQAAEQISATWGTGNLFPLLGVGAAMGRTLGPEDDRVGAPEVVVISHGLWVRRYGSDPAIVNRTIRIDGVPHTVVGVLPRNFNFPFNAVEVWLPMRADPAESPRSQMGTLVVGRMAQGWTRETAQAELGGIHRGLAAAFPEEDGRYNGIHLKPMREALNFGWDILSRAFVIMLVGVAFVLVIACVNVASLTLARLSTRTREVALRRSMGAGRGRLVQQFLVEALVLAILGGALGVALTYLGTGMLAGLVPPDLYRVGEVSVDGRVLAFTAAVSLSTPFFFALVPAWTTAGRSLSDGLKEGSAGGGIGREAVRGRRLLVVAEVALGMILVAGTGLMMRSLANAMSLDVGFPATQILTAEVSIPEADGADASARDNRFENLMDGLAALPGVAAVGSVSNLPLNHETMVLPYAAPDGLDIPVEERPLALTSRAGPDYFQSMEIPLVAGRAFRPEDGEAEGAGVVVSRSLAERLWPGAPAVGRTLAFGRGSDPISATVLGVVEDVHYDGLVNAPQPHLYRPLMGSGSRRRFLVIRVAAGTTPGSLMEPVRRAVFGLDPDVAAGLRPMMDILKESTALWAISSLFLGIFGAVALALAALGLYGLVAFSVAQRRREMGLRLALGAEKVRILGKVVGEGIRITAVGLVLGGIGSVGSGMLLSSLLLGVGPLDVLTLSAVVSVFLLVSVAATVFPARRASAVEPAEALRME